MPGISGSAHRFAYVRSPPEGKLLNGKRFVRKRFRFFQSHAESHGE